MKPVVALEGSVSFADPIFTRRGVRFKDHAAFDVLSSLLSMNEVMHVTRSSYDSCYLGHLPFGKATLLESTEKPAIYIRGVKLMTRPASS